VAVTAIKLAPFNCQLKAQQIPQVVFYEMQVVHHNQERRIQANWLLETFTIINKIAQ